MKTEVYSWRLESDLKQALEDTARSDRTSVAELLNRIAREWLKRGQCQSEDERQALIREEAMRYAGTVPMGKGPYTAERVREQVRSNLRRDNGPKRPR